MDNVHAVDRFSYEWPWLVGILALVLLVLLIVSCYFCWRSHECSGEMHYIDSTKPRSHSYYDCPIHGPVLIGGYEYSGIVQSPSTITSTSTVVSDAPDARPTSHQHNHHNHTSRSGSKPASRRASRNYSPGSRRASRNYSHHYQSLPRNTSISDRSSVHYDNEVRGPK